VRQAYIRIEVHKQPVSVTFFLRKFAAFVNAKMGIIYCILFTCLLQSLAVTVTSNDVRIVSFEAS